jgi:hypothetical protein
VGKSQDMQDLIINRSKQFNEFLVSQYQSVQSIESVLEDTIQAASRLPETKGIRRTLQSYKRQILKNT